MDDIEIQIRDYISENFVLGQDEQGFSDNDSFLDSGLIDSTGILELIAFVEETFDIEILDEEMVPENLDSISNVSNFIRSKKS
jgi:acyl carrier protein